jgi:hypothetical protein
MKISDCEYKISVLNPANLSKVESTLARKYKNSMVVWFYNKGRIPEDWSVESRNRENNTLKLKKDWNRDFSSIRGRNNKTVSERQSWNP